MKRQERSDNPRLSRLEVDALKLAKEYFPATRRFRNRSWNESELAGYFADFARRYAARKLREVADLICGCPKARMGWRDHGAGCRAQEILSLSKSTTPRRDGGRKSK